MTTNHDAISDINNGLSLLATLAQLLEDGIGQDMKDFHLTAAAALAQKAGGFIECGLRSAGVLDGPGVVGNQAEWMRI